MRRASSLVGGLGLFRGDDLDQSAGSADRRYFFVWIGSQYLPRRTPVILS